MPHAQTTPVCRHPAKAISRALGPVTMLQWSFVRDDQPRSKTTFQIALALRDEIVDLEAAGIHIIQVDEPAFREGLPLRRSEWDTYLQWAVDAFHSGDSVSLGPHMDAGGSKYFNENFSTNYLWYLCFRKAVGVLLASEFSEVSYFLVW